MYVPELIFSYENRKELNTKEKLLNFIQKHLKRKEYVIVAIDTSKVSSYSNFLKNSIIHPPMISRLDLANSKILIHDFMDYSKYQSSWISIDEFFEAYSEIQNKIILNSSVNKSLEEELWVSRLELIRFNKNTVINNSYIEKRVIRELFNYYCSINKRVVDIDAYSYVNSILNDTDTFLYKKEVVEGRGVLECYQNYLLTVRDSESKLKLKPFYMLHMHYVILNNVINNTFNNSNSIPEIKKAINLTQKILFLAILFNDKGNNLEKLAQIESFVNELRELEEVLNDIFTQRYFKA